MPNTSVAADAPAATGALPVWSLDDLYSGQDSVALSDDLARMERETHAFHQRWAGRLALCGAEGLAQAITEFEVIDETLSRLMSYGSLVYAGDMSDTGIGRFYQTLQERVNKASVSLVFFTLEINRLDDALLAGWLAQSPALARYRPWLVNTRILRPHQLGDEMERLLHEKHVVGRAAWNRLFDETVAALRFPVGGQELTCTEALNKLSDTNGTVRREAAETVGKVLDENIRVFSLVMNTLVKDKEIDDQWRNYAHPAAARNLSNRVDDDLVEALVAAVKSAYPELSHCYYALKARWFGCDRLDYWDRNAPLPENSDRHYSWEQACGVVMGAYQRFSPELATVAQRFFDNAWIDAGIRPGKAPGAFAHPCVPSVHPYLLLNFQGRARDVMTLAHELGHGVHQCLAARQGHLMADTPLTLAETASVFGEMLTFRALLDAETDPQRRRIMLASKVEDMLNTVVRQIAFYDFEWRVHNERRKGEITAERLGELWLEVQTESLGPALRFDTNYSHYWAYIPHFIHSPFYVYAYAFGDCMVNSLYAVYGESPEGFVGKYIDLLAAGGTRSLDVLLAPFGLDPADPSFWHKGLNVVRGLIDTLAAEG